MLPHRRRPGLHQGPACFQRCWWSRSSCGPDWTHPADLKDDPRRYSLCLEGWTRASLVCKVTFSSSHLFFSSALCYVSHQLFIGVIILLLQNGKNVMQGHTVFQSSPFSSALSYVSLHLFIGMINMILQNDLVSLAITLLKPSNETILFSDFCIFIYNVPLFRISQF